MSVFVWGVSTLGGPDTLEFLTGDLVSWFSDESQRLDVDIAAYGNLRVHPAPVPFPAAFSNTGPTGPTGVTGPTAALP